MLFNCDSLTPRLPWKICDIITQYGNMGWVPNCMGPFNLVLLVQVTASLHVFPSLDVLSVGAWGALKELRGDDLKRLAGALPASVLHCRATSKTKKYLGAYKCWKACAVGHSISYFPASDCHLVWYLQHLSDAKGSKSAVEETVNSLALVHRLAGLSSPSTSSIVQVALEGLKRTLARPGVKKSPFTVEMLKAIVDDNKSGNTLTSIRLTAACLLSFAGFLWFD